MIAWSVLIIGRSAEQSLRCAMEKWFPLANHKPTLCCTVILTPQALDSVAACALPPRSYQDALSPVSPHCPTKMSRSLADVRVLNASNSCQHSGCPRSGRACAALERRALFIITYIETAYPSFLSADSRRVQQQSEYCHSALRPMPFGGTVARCTRRRVSSLPWQTSLVGCQT